LHTAWLTISLSEQVKEKRKTKFKYNEVSHFDIWMMHCIRSCHWKSQYHTTVL